MGAVCSSEEAVALTSGEALCVLWSRVVVEEARINAKMVPRSRIILDYIEIIIDFIIIALFM